MKLMVLFMHQLQLIGIKTNLESFVTTTLMEHMLNRHQLHFFLWVSKQWGLSTGQADLTTILPFPMTESFISLCCANSYWTNAGCDVSNTAITLSQAQTDKASTRHDGPLCWLVLGK